MKNKRLIIEYNEYEGVEELSLAERELVEAAKKATETSYSPYSKFSVGAAVRMADGSVETGSNQENIAYPSGLCAERVAMFGASVRYPGQAVESLAIVGRDQRGEYVEASPCGACRQVMAEMEGRYGKEIQVFCYLKGGRIREIKGVRNLLPFGFEAEL